MARSKRSNSSQRWLTEHFSDSYVKKAQADGFRSRSVFKLIEIQQKHKIFKTNSTVIDLGAAPGGWSQFAAQEIGDKGKIIASDILPMDPINQVIFVQGDFTEQTTLDRIFEAIGQQHVDLVLSDMAPNISGIKAVDQPKSMYLAELALDLAQNVLGNTSERKENGDFLVKVFQGEGFDDYLRLLRSCFTSVFIRKPAASRPRSREVYLLARGYTHD